MNIISYCHIMKIRKQASVYKFHTCLALKIKDCEYFYCFFPFFFLITLILRFGHEGWYLIEKLMDWKVWQTISYVSHSVQQPIPIYIIT